MNLIQALSLYAPFAGLMALAFWMGVLSQRVKQIEKAIDDHGSTHDTVIRLEVTVKAQAETLLSVDRNMQGINRQLANISSSNFEFRKGGD